MITIINYGIGNMGSMLNMFKRINVPAKIESDPDKIFHGEKLILPGVGSFDAAIERINAIDGLREVLDQKALKEKTPILGVCLGMQLLTTCSEEGKLPGLNWIPGKTQLLPKNLDIKVPHMGWNVASISKSSPLTNNLVGEQRYYFVHSYYVKTNNEDHAIMKTDYGLPFDSAIANENIYGVQFHPEKSHKFGMKILTNFAKI